MAVLGYTNPDRVQGRWGKTLTAPQLTECNRLVGAAERFIDQTTGLTWLYPSVPVTETHKLYGRRLRLRRSPVVAVASVSVRHRAAGASTIVLGATEYELFEPTTGDLLLGTYCEGYFATVVYTPEAKTEVDERVELAATDLVLAWMQPILMGVSGDIKSYSVAGDLSVTYRDGDMTLSVPGNILGMLKELRPKTLLFG